MNLNRLRSISLSIIMIGGMSFINADLISTTYSGKVNGVMAAFATAKNTGGSKILKLTDIPTGATILSATLLGHSWYSNADATLSATFNGIDLGLVSASNSDGNLSSYEWDVTSLITGAGNYTASYDGAGSYGLALSVVFSDTSLPEALLVLNKGALTVAAGGVAQTIHSSVAGASELWIYTQADNYGGQTGETINLNGEVIGGPIDNNLGPYASLFHISNVTSIAGENVVSIKSPADLFGWDISMLKTLVTDKPAVPVTEPSFLNLLLMSGVSLIGIKIRKRR